MHALPTHTRARAAHPAAAGERVPHPRREEGLSDSGDGVWLSGPVRARRSQARPGSPRLCVRAERPPTSVLILSPRNPSGKANRSPLETQWLPCRQP